MTEPEQPRHIELTHDGLGRSQVLVDGVDVSNQTSEAVLEVLPNRLPKITLTVLGARYTGPAILELKQADVVGESNLSYLRSWLAAQVDDPSVKEAAMGGALSTDPLDAILAELLRRAHAA